MSMTFQEKLKVLKNHGLAEQGMSSERVDEIYGLNFSNKGIEEFDYRNPPNPEEVLRKAMGESLYKHNERNKALSVKRVIITNLNPDKVNDEAIFVDASNELTGKHAVTVPYGKPWHVSQIVLNVLKEKKYIKHVKTKVDGHDVTKPVSEAEIAITYLNPMTDEEMKRMAEYQQRRSDGEKETSNKSVL